MLLPDVNVLIYAHVEDSIPDHADYATWITRLATAKEPFALSVLVLSGFVRVVTNRCKKGKLHRLHMRIIGDLSIRSH